VEKTSDLLDLDSLDLGFRVEACEDAVDFNGIFKLAQDFEESSDVRK
jgi:hypothetical protein